MASLNRSCCCQRPWRQSHGEHWSPTQPKTRTKNFGDCESKQFGFITCYLQMIYEQNSNRNTLMYMMRMSLMTLTRGRPGAMNSPIQTVPFVQIWCQIHYINTTTRVNYLSLPCSNYKRNKIQELQKRKEQPGCWPHQEYCRPRQTGGNWWFSETILYQDLWISWEWALKVPKPAVVHHLNLSSWRTARPINFGICFCRNQILVCPSFVMLWFCQIW